MIHYCLFEFFTPECLEVVMFLWYAIHFDKHVALKVHQYIFLWIMPKKKILKPWFSTERNKMFSIWRNSYNYKKSRNGLIENCDHSEILKSLIPRNKKNCNGSLKDYIVRWKSLNNWHIFERFASVIYCMPVSVFKYNIEYFSLITEITVKVYLPHKKKIFKVLPYKHKWILESHRSIS